MGFRNLFRKEMKSLFPLFAVYGIAVTAAQVIVKFKSGGWGTDAPLVISLLMPLLFAAVLTIGAGYFQLSTEWRTNTIYLLLSLPIRGWKVLTAKLVALMVLLVGTLLWVSGSFSLILLRSMWKTLFSDQVFGEIPLTMLNVAGNSLWMCLLTIVLFVMLAQFAFLCGQLVTRFRWLVALAAFFAGLWLIFRAAPLLSMLLAWLPDIRFGGELDDVIYLHSGMFVALVLLAAGLMWLNGYLFEKVVEV
ncbi:hypothetical protein [Paenibacillus methanolicus]|uniref:ABC-2 type transport system permease protein n=1 Tax=Paenibacillus methanolicus TaxID=582686 RepID=A0A5S5CHW9_9BACL|nr:hypothetical protein [Paenibacillus methanolicus]TYP78208.1 hypothetical protein BCM02_102785 [Paenibacillus methanolicus]